MTRPHGRRERPTGGGSWYRITNRAADGPAQIMIYDEIGMWGVTASDFIRDLAAIGDGPVEVHINSGGGDVFDAYAIYNSLVARPDVTTVVDALAASAASVIAMAGEQRLMARASQMMIHDASSFLGGNADEMQHMVERLQTVSGQIAGIYAATAGGELDYWRNLMRAETWFTPQEALDAGLITGITGEAREPAAAAAPAAAAPGTVVAAASGADTPVSAGVTNEAAVQAAPENAPQVNPDSAPPSQSNAAGAPAVNERNTAMPEDQGALTIEARRSRNTEITARLQEIAAAYPAAVLPTDAQAEWDQISAERRDHQSALDAVEARNAELAQILAVNPASHDAPRPQGGVQPPAGGPRFGAPAVHTKGVIYDLGAIRQQASNAEELPGLYRDYAIRAIEEHRFHGTGTKKNPMTREEAQANVEKLLYIADDTTGSVARRVIATGSPEYLRAYTAALKAGRVPAGRDGELLNAIGDGTQGGGLAVPFQLDPTMILVSNGAINPLRQISRVEQITGKEYDLVTSTGVVVSRKAEFAVETDNSPTLLQPTIQPKRVSAWIPFSVELEGDWSGLQASMMSLLADAKDVEESNSFTLGAGTGVTAGGVVTLQAGGSLVTLTGGVATLSFKDPETLESAMAPRFRTAASYLASKTTYNKYRNLFAAQAGFATDPWNRPTLGQPRELWGYPAYEDSDMVATNATGDKVLLMGDFGRGFIIVDRVGMNVELVPTVFGAGANSVFPTGTRGYYAWWRNNSTVLIPNAFRLGVVG